MHTNVVEFTNVYALRKYYKKVQANPNVDSITVFTSNDGHYELIYRMKKRAK